MGKKSRSKRERGAAKAKMKKPGLPNDPEFIRSRFRQQDAKGVAPHSNEVALPKGTQIEPAGTDQAEILPSAIVIFIPPCRMFHRRTRPVPIAAASRRDRASTAYFHPLKLSLRCAPIFS